MKVTIDPKERERWATLRKELASCGGHTNTAILQQLAVQYRKEEQVETTDDFKNKNEARVAAHRPGGIEQQSLWRLRFKQSKTVQKITLNDSDHPHDHEVNLMTRFVKRKYKDEQHKEKKPVPLADNVQEILMKLTSTFNDQINDAMRSDTTNPRISNQENNPVSALIQLQAIGQNMKAIDRDMAVLAQNKSQNNGEIGKLLVGFGWTGDNEESEGSVENDPSKDNEKDDDDDSELSSEYSDESTHDDCNDQNMKEMANEMGIVVPEGLNIDEFLLADSDIEDSSSDDSDSGSDSSLSEENDSSDDESYYDSESDEEEEEARFVKQMSQLL